MSRRPIIAAGCLITRQGRKGVEVLLVHRPRYHDWSLPKGKVDVGEHITEAAVREVLEETGLVVALRRPLPLQTYQVDGVSGATVTMDGVSKMLHDGIALYLPFLEKERAASQVQGMLQQQ